ncbi:MAG: hypothetical protein CL477_08415 [Acidobacteria bacterium]|nr:hypothetical protein [Acidobacteriota bacterium]
MVYSLTVIIGTLNEGPLHQALKVQYARRYAASSRSSSEVQVGDYVADVLGDDNVLYEIQTGGFGTIRRKLEHLVGEHKVVLVHPIAAVRTIVKVPDAADAEATRRRSPKRGHPAHVLDQLVYIPALLAHPNFELEVVMVEEDEVRVFDPGRVRRRGGWRVVHRQLNAVVERHRFRCLDDLFGLLEAPLPDPFTTLELAEALNQPRRLAQKMAYVLREAGATRICGKTGNAMVYRRARKDGAEAC